MIFINRLAKYFEKRKPLGKLIKTDSFNYLYDSGTNKILKCDNLTYDLLENLFLKQFNTAIKDFIKENGEDCLKKTASTLNESIDIHNLFDLYEVTNFNIFPDKQELSELLHTNMNTLGLEVTEQCNLRCHYCIYNKENKRTRFHSNKKMKTDIAMEAINYLKQNSKKKK